MDQPLPQHREIAPNRYRETAGLYFEDFVPGDVFEHRPGRTITETDNIWMTLLSMNTQQLHFDSAFASHTEWKKPLVNSTFVLSVLTGMSVRTVSAKVVANLGWDKVRASHPVFVGDTLYAETEILSKRLSQSRPTQGIVNVATTGRNQDGDVIMTFERTMLIYTRDGSPDAASGY